MFLPQLMLEKQQEKIHLFLMFKTYYSHTAFKEINNLNYGFKTVPTKTFNQRK